MLNFVFLWLLSSVASAANRGSTVSSPTEFSVDDYLESPNTHYRFVFQHDGNFVLRDLPGGRGAPLFSTQATTSEPVAAFLQSDGNFVIYRGLPGARSVLFNAATVTAAVPVTMRMQNDRNVVIVDSNNQAIWQSGTSLESVNIPPPTLPPNSCNDAATTPAERLCQKPLYGAPFDALPLNCKNGRFKVHFVLTMNPFFHSIVADSCI